MSNSEESKTPVTTADGTTRPTNSAVPVKKSNTTLIIVVIVSVVLLLMCCCCTLFLGLSSMESAVEQFGEEFEKEFQEESKTVNKRSSDPDSYYDSSGQTTADWKVNLSRSEDPYVNTQVVDYLVSPDERMVAVELEVRNTATFAQTFPQYLLNLSDNKGNSYYPTYLVTKEPKLAGDPVDPGKSMKGWVVYVVSKDSDGLVIEYVASASENSIKFEL